MEQMVVQLLAPRNAKHHFCKSCKSDEMFGVVQGGAGKVKAGCLTQLIEHWNRFFVVLSNHRRHY